MKVIVNCRIITEKQIIPDAVLIIDGRLIREFGPAELLAPRLSELADCEVLDAGGDFLGPGFIDLHCHGGGGVWWHEEPEVFAETHLRHGSTGLLATSGMYKDLDELCRGLDRIREGMQSGSCPNILGVQMEGPYKNPKYGAQPELSIRINELEYRKILEHGSDIIKIWTVAPELEGIDPFIETVSALGHILSIGHSEASPEEILKNLSNRLILACHAFDATGTSPKLKGEAGTRSVSVDDMVLLEDRIYAEVIPDAAGVHVRPQLLQLILKAKGVDKVVVITDGTTGSGIKGVLPGESDLNFNENGLCGSNLTMDRAARNMMMHTGASLPEIFLMASLNPARVLNVDHAYGSIRPWKIANLVLVDSALNLKKVIFQGEVIQDSPGM